VTHPLDLALQQTLPVMGMPLHGCFERLAANGQRLIIGSNGVFVESRRAWLHAVAHCGVVDPAMRMPFGEVPTFLDLPYGLLPRELISRFVEIARNRFPNEVAGAVVLDTREGSFELRIHEDSGASPSHVAYRAQPLRSHEALVVDIHSHGALPAGFSRQDDLDDRGSTKIAAVVGRVDEPSPEIAVRLCLNGVHRPLLSGRWSEEGLVECAT